MAQYILLLVAGLLFLYQIVLPWGMSAGLASPGPYYALLGGLLAFPVAAALSVRLPRVGAWSGLLGGMLGLVWPVTGYMLGFGGVLEMMLFAALPTLIAGFSLYRILRLRAAPRPKPRMSVALTVLLTALPFGLFFALFNSRGISTVILQGPPPWPGGAPR